MTSWYRTDAGITAAPAVASLAGATPAGADRNPAQRVPTNQHGAELTQDLYYTSHNPSIPAAGHAVRTIDAARDSNAVPAPRPRARTMHEPPSGNGFEWGDAASGVWVMLGPRARVRRGAAAITRRHRPAEELELSW